MKLEDFFQKVESHDKLRGLAIDKNEHGEGMFAVEDLNSKLVTVLPAGAVEKSDWQILEDVLTCKREPQVLYHMTRVVGYYSRVENWNKSKIGELSDRHKGDYAVA